MKFMLIKNFTYNKTSGQAVDAPVEKCVLTNKIRRTFMNKRNLIVTLMMMTGLFAQSIVGVVNSGEEPLIGANVAVEGTDKGGVTDNSGKYIIDIGAEGTFT